MKKLFQVSATIESISTRKDRTMKCFVGTQELVPEQMAILMDLHDKIGWFLFAENELRVEDVPNVDAVEFSGDKSPSKRLRDFLFIYWEKCTDKKTPFDMFWKNWCDKKCNEIRESLPKI